MACLLVSCSAWPIHAEQIQVPHEFVGDWVPRKQSCDLPLRLRVEPKSVSLVNGRDVQRFTNLDLCRTCESGFHYQGNVVWLTPEPDKDGAVPFTIRFNENEQRGITLVEFEQDDLKRRFPLHNAKLRKCPTQR